MTQKRQNDALPVSLPEVEFNLTDPNYAGKAAVYAKKVRRHLAEHGVYDFVVARKEEMDTVKLIVIPGLPSDDVPLSLDSSSTPHQEDGADIDALPTKRSDVAPSKDLVVGLQPPSGRKAGS